MWTIGVSVACLLVGPTQAVVLRENPAKSAEHKSLRSGDLITPLKIDQKLLVCNAYPSKSSVEVQRNGHDLLGGVKDGLGFKECRYVESRVQKFDRLEFAFRDVEVAGTFEVGDLPASNALLLLVLEKRNASHNMGFQSFAFPSTSDANTAQLAVINAVHGSSTHLQMEDHDEEDVNPDRKVKKQVAPKRSEQLNFDRVYSVEQGDYDACITGASGCDAVSKANTSNTSNTSKKAFRLDGNTNFVVLRTGGDGTDFPEDLVVFPQRPVRGLKSNSERTGFAAVILAVIFAMFAN